ncbi:MAG: hypothetical protein HKL80_06850 [Acidimicrobiales bacterium]|nr:hypothetical protein [Acidimicrobiales bacterium]
MANLTKKVRVNPWFVALIIIYLVVAAIYVNRSSLTYSCDYVYILQGFNLTQAIFGFAFIVFFPGIANGLMVKGKKNKVAKIVSSNLLLFLINMVSMHIISLEIMRSWYCSDNFFVGTYLDNFGDEALIFAGLGVLSIVCSLLFLVLFGLNRIMKSVKEDYSRKLKDGEYQLDNQGRVGAMH